MVSETLGTGTARIESAEDNAFNLVLSEELTDALGLNAGDPVTVTVERNSDGTTTITGTLENVELTDDQRETLRAALDAPANNTGTSSDESHASQ